MKTTLFTCLLALCMACAAPRRERLKDVAEKAEVSFFLDESQRKLVDGSNEFGIRLFQVMAQAHPDSSMVISPMGVVYSLNMLNNGTDGETLAEICKALGYGEGDLQRVNELCRTFLVAQRKKYRIKGQQTDDYMHTANLLATIGEDVVKGSFKEVLASNYFADAISATSVNQLQQQADQWISEQTEGKVKQLPLKLSANAQACLANTIVFQGGWAQCFDEESTRKAPFYCEDGSIDSVWMMSRHLNDDTFKGRYDEHFIALRMPYRGQFNITMLLPVEGQPLINLVKQLDARMLQEINNSLVTFDEVHVRIPRMRLNTSVALKPLLAKVGIKQTFSQTAHLSKMSSGALWVNDIVQQTQFSLDEQGSTAISSTATELGALSDILQPRELHFTANRPFLYYISDGFGNVCFIGQYCGGKR